MKQNDTLAFPYSKRNFNNQNTYVGSNLPPTRTHFSVVVHLTSGALAPEKQVATVHERSCRRAVRYSTFRRHCLRRTRGGNFDIGTNIQIECPLICQITDKFKLTKTRTSHVLSISGSSASPTISNQLVITDTMVSFQCWIKAHPDLGRLDPDLTMLITWPPPRRRASDDCGGCCRPDTKAAHRINGGHAWPPPSVGDWRAAAIWFCRAPSHHWPSSSDSTPSRWSGTTAIVVALKCNFSASGAFIRRTMVRTSCSQARA